MKKNAIRPGNFDRLLLLIAVICWAPLAAQTEKSRTVERAFDGKTALWASHRNGDLIVKKGDGSQIKAVLSITATSKRAEDLDDFLARFDLETTEAPDNKIDIKTSDIIQCWNEINGKSTIKFKDGKSYSGIVKFRMTLEITVPKLRYATLENKYAAIKTEAGVADVLQIDLYDGSLDAPGNFDRLTLDVKYSKGNVGNFNDCKGQLYDSDLNLGNGGALALDSKYSGIVAGNLSQLKLNCFDDHYTIGAVTGETTITDKYSEFEFKGALANVSLNLYDSKVDAQNGDNVYVAESKYTEFSFGELNSLQFVSSFDDAVRLKKVGALSANQSKYTEYTIDGIWKSLSFPDSFDDEISVRTVGATFDALTFNAKYTELRLPIPDAVKFEIDASLKYGSLKPPATDMETSDLSERGDVITYKARSRGAGAGAPKFSIQGYDSEVRLQ